MFVQENARIATMAGPGRIVHGWARAFAAFTEWNSARLTRKALSRLSAHELEDIGLTRDDINRIF